MNKHKFEFDFWKSEKKQISVRKVSLSKKKKKIEQCNKLNSFFDKEISIHY